MAFQNPFVLVPSPPRQRLPTCCKKLVSSFHPETATNVSSIVTTICFWHRRHHLESVCSTRLLAVIIPPLIRTSLMTCTSLVRAARLRHFAFDCLTLNNRKCAYVYMCMLLVGQHAYNSLAKAFG